MKKLLITMTMFLGMSTVLTGCGKQPIENDVAEVENWDEDDFEQAALNAEKEYSDESFSVGQDDATETTTNENITFEPLPEIMNASLKDPVIQVFDDLFYPGQYTLDETIEKYGDKYDFSGIDTELFTATNLYATRKDSNYMIGLKLSTTTDDHVRIGDLIVEDVNPYDGTTKLAVRLAWLPGGIKDNFMEFDENEECLYDYSTFVSDYLGREGKVFEATSDLSEDRVAKYFSQEGADVVYRYSARSYDVWVKVDSSEYLYDEEFLHRYWKKGAWSDYVLDESRNDYYVVRQYTFNEDSATGKIYNGYQWSCFNVIEIPKS